MYVAKFEEAVYVLHCFQKKTSATSKQDQGIAQARYRAVVNARKHSVGSQDLDGLAAPDVRRGEQENG